MEPNASSPAGGPQGPEAGPRLPTPEVAGAVQPELQPDTQVERAPAAQEVDRPAGEAANQNAGMQVVVQDPQVVQPVSDDPAQGGTTTQTATTDLNTPDLANDVDVIEKEWVDKAKEIVDITADDPYKQNHNVSLLKADYMKKRYGKDIKVPDDAPPKKG